MIHLTVCLLALVAVAGCGDSGPRFEPVRGQVLLSGQPLTTGSVSFRPDAARGDRGRGAGRGSWLSGAAR